MFYKNSKRHLGDSQIKLPEESNPIDVTVKEADKEVNFQVTRLRRKIEGALLKWGSVFFKEEPEKIKEDVRNAINDKESKSGSDVTLLLHTSLPTERELFERAIDGLSIVSSFKEIYIVTPDCNIPVKC